MQAMIFAAGMGTRLKPLTDIIPKALVPIGEKPLLQLVTEKLLLAGFDHVVVNVHHKAGQIRNFLSLLSASHAELSLSVSDESSCLLETGGGIKAARAYFSADEPILIHNVDIISNIDLAAIYNKIGNADALLVVSSRKTQRYLIFSDDMRLIGWTNIATGEVRSPYGITSVETPEGEFAGGEIRYTVESADGSSPHVHTGQAYAFSGIHVFSPALFNDMDEWEERFPIMDFYLKLCGKRNIIGHKLDDLKLLDVGKLDTLENSLQFLESL